MSESLFVFTGLRIPKYEILYNGTGFIIEGFTDAQELQLPIFFIFLLIYFIILFGNAAILIAILGDSNLHTPMYIFLVKLSFIDITYASNIILKLLHILLTQHKTISFSGCMIQLYFFISLTCTEFLLLGAMAYDRYVAICHPLHYYILMTIKKSCVLNIMVWVIGSCDTMAHTIVISKMSFCASHHIDHFFCDVTPLLKLSCSGTSNVEMITYINGSLLIFPAFLLTLTSYVLIISNILKIKSEEGRRKAFSTCTSHLTSVTMFYGTILCLYMRPTTSYSPSLDKYFSLIYVVMIPILNPIIYSLKNQDIKNALKKHKNKMSFKRQ
ncbi:olfactory receptor 1019-like [Spea bombifrons]|uniref:olfactory receptor 1019-like n=1 Tax=Spea bombifrons TaxID=233779 RepID=UPI002349BF37|nr:olfactory receptor 1019-like [Spea bombifrons]